jgi:hypothetical protein
LEVNSLARGVEELNELVAFTTGRSGVNLGEDQVAGMGQGGRRSAKAAKICFIVAVAVSIKRRESRV